MVEVELHNILACCHTNTLPHLSHSHRCFFSFVLPNISRLYFRISMDINKFASVTKLCRRMEFHSEKLCFMKNSNEFSVFDILFYIPLMFLAISFGFICTVNTHKQVLRHWKYTFGEHCLFASHAISVVLSARQITLSVNLVFGVKRNGFSNLNGFCLEKRVKTFCERLSNFPCAFWKFVRLQVLQLLSACFSSRFSHFFSLCVARFGF